MWVAVCSTCLWTKLISTKLTPNEQNSNWTKIYANVEKSYCGQTTNRQQRSKSQTPGILQHTLDHCLQSRSVPFAQSPHVCSSASFPTFWASLQPLFMPIHPAKKVGAGTVLIQCSLNVWGGVSRLGKCCSKYGMPSIKACSYLDWKADSQLRNMPVVITRIKGVKQLYHMASCPPSSNKGDHRVLGLSRQQRDEAFLNYIPCRL